MAETNVETRPPEPPPKPPEVPRSTELVDERHQPDPARGARPATGAQTMEHEDAGAAAKSEFAKANGDLGDRSVPAQRVPPDLGTGGTVEAKGRQAVDGDQARSASADEFAKAQGTTGVDSSLDEMDRQGSPAQVRDLATPTRTPDSHLAAGDPVYQGEHSTAVGYDGSTMANFDNIAPREGYHDVVIHGTDEGMFRPGAVDAQGRDVPGDLTHPAQIAEAVRSNPDYDGEPVRLVSCHAAVSDQPGQPPAAQQLADALGVPVTAPTGTVGVERYGGPGQEPTLGKNVEWLTFVPARDVEELT